jgi:hypothetical protein
MSALKKEYGPDALADLDKLLPIREQLAKLFIVVFNPDLPEQ